MGKGKRERKQTKTLNLGERPDHPTVTPTTMSDDTGDGTSDETSDDHQHSPRAGVAWSPAPPHPVVIK